MFFALSGFLIAGSAMRLSIGNFLTNRSLQIVPALAVDVVVCSLLIGPLFSTLSLQAYFSDVRFYSYFLNIFGYIHYSLPGVFEDHFNTRVNGALWTVPCEIICYVVISAFIVTKLLHRPAYIAAIIGLMIAAGLIAQTSIFEHYVPWRIRVLANFFFVSRNAQLFLAFMCGLLAFLIKDRLPYDRRIFLAFAATCLGAAFLLDHTATGRVENRIILIPAITYMTIFIGLTPMWIPRYFRRGDYSYGIYLYHDPILQSVISLFPVMAMTRGYGALFTFICGIPFVILLATASWHLIEKPILSLRKRFSFVARVRGVEDAVKPAKVRPSAVPPDARAPGADPAYYSKQDSAAGAHQEKHRVRASTAE